MNRPPAVLVALLLTLLSGCEDDRSQYIREYCDQTCLCCARTGLPRDGERCRSTMASGTEGLVFHPEVGERCLAALRAASPADYCLGALPLSPAACVGVFTGTGSRQPGESCASHADCAPVAGANSCFFGRCFATVYVNTIGGECQLDSSASTARLCVGGLFCDQSGTCQKARAESETCTPESPCAQELYCDPTGACRPRRAVSARCETTASCEPGAFCDSAGLCTSKRLAGEPCGTDDECAAGHCAVGGCTAGDLESVWCTTERVTVR